MAKNAAQHVLGEYVRMWTSRIEAARQDRKSFDEMARTAFDLFASFDYTEVFKRLKIDPHTLDVRVGMNKVAEYVQLFRARLYRADPNRQVLSRHDAQFDPLSQMPSPTGLPAPSPQAQRDKLVSLLLNKLLNFTPTELGLKRNSQLAIDQALLSGRGCLWTELDERTGLYGSFFGDTAELLIDPDASSLDEAWWIARERWAPAWYIEENYGFGPFDPLTPNASSSDAQSRSYAPRQGERAPSRDLVRYYEIYSKVGLGSRLEGGERLVDDTEDELREAGMLGDYVYLLIAPGASQRPLNFDPAGPAAEEMLRLQWPVAFWEDDEWPVTVLDFIPIAGRPWPMSPVQPARGELLFIQWIMSHLGGKVRTTCRDFVAVAKQLEDTEREKLLHSSDLFVLELDQDDMLQLDSMVRFIQHPPWNKDIVEFLSLLEHQVEMRLGLTELLTGQMTKQMRTQAEAFARTEFTRLRPDAMADAVEEWQTSAARKEALASRSMLTTVDETGQPTMLARVLGNPQAAQAWQQVVRTGVRQAAMEMEYRVESGSVRKPDKDREVDNAQILAKMLMPFAQARAAAGDPRMFNALMQQMARAMNIGNVQEFMVGPPLPGLMPGQEGAGGVPGQPNRMQAQRAPGGAQPGRPQPTQSDLMARGRQQAAGNRGNLGVAG